MASPLQTNLKKIQSTLTQFNDWVKAMYRHKEYDYSPLPYVPLEYIQSSGTQYMNFGINAIKGYKFVLDFQIVTATSNVWFCGINMDFEAGLEYASNFYTGAGFTYSQNSNVKTRTTATGIVSKAVAQNVYLFARNWTGEYRPTAMKLYSAKIYDASGTLIRDYIPVKNLDGIVCLYDKITETFLYNIGTGNFIAGGEI